MVFSSIGFIYIFLPAVLMLHAVLPMKLKNCCLLLFSLVFYFIGGQMLLLVMIGCELVAFFSALLIRNFSERKVLKKLFLAVGIIVSFGALIYFKYADLLITSFSWLSGFDIPLLKVALPIGISFYTFQSMGYVIDVYRGDTKPTRNVIDFMTFVSAFPQLIAGPIVLYNDVEAALKLRRVTINGFVYGIKRFCIGLAEKVLIADTLAELSNKYSATDEHTLLFSWLCIIAFTLQLYFDFAGYSNMAIGIGKMLGFDFPENFDHPMVSKSAVEFWRRWHITLGGWFRDYLYIPLGGNRKGKSRQILNLLIVWLCTGLWHGAEYSFVLWGLYYGILIIAEKFLYGKFLEKTKVVSHIYFTLITAVGFCIFTSESLSSIPKKVGELFGIGVCGLYDENALYLLGSYITVILIAVICALPVGRSVKKAMNKLPCGSAIVEYTVGVFSLILLVVCTAFLVDGSFSPFLYFRF